MYSTSFFAGNELSPRSRFVQIIMSKCTCAASKGVPRDFPTRLKKSTPSFTFALSQSATTLRPSPARNHKSRFRVRIPIDRPFRVRGQLIFESLAQVLALIDAAVAGLVSSRQRKENELEHSRVSLHAESRRIEDRE